MYLNRMNCSYLTHSMYFHKSFQCKALPRCVLSKTTTVIWLSYFIITLLQCVFCFTKWQRHTFWKETISPIKFLADPQLCIILFDGFKKKSLIHIHCLIELARSKSIRHPSLTLLKASPRRLFTLVPKPKEFLNFLIYMHCWNMACHCSMFRYVSWPQGFMLFRRIPRSKINK